MANEKLIENLRHFRYMGITDEAAEALEHADADIAAKDAEIARLQVDRKFVAQLLNEKDGAIADRDRLQAELDAALRLLPHVCTLCALDGKCELQKEDGRRYGAYTCGDKWKFSGKKHCDGE